MNLLDPRFKYVPAVKTNVMETFYRHGFRRTTDEERRARQLRNAANDANLDQAARQPLERDH